MTAWCSSGDRRRIAAPVSGALLTALFATAALAQAWTAYVNPRFGFSLYYPVELFKPADPLPEDAGQIFSGDNAAVLRTEGAFDERRFGAKHYLGLALEDPANVRPVSQQLEDFSYTLTADRGDMLHYERWVFSCREQIISKIAMTYPKTEQAKYEAIVPKLAQRFQAGSGYATPDNCV